MSDREVFNRPAIAEVYDWILFHTKQVYGLETLKQAAVWMSANGNSHGYSPYFLDYCNYISNLPEDDNETIEF